MNSENFDHAGESDDTIREAFGRLQNDAGKVNAMTALQNHEAHTTAGWYARPGALISGFAVVAVLFIGAFFLLGNGESVVEVDAPVASDSGEPEITPDPPVTPDPENAEEPETSEEVDEPAPEGSEDSEVASTTTAVPSTTAVPGQPEITEAVDEPVIEVPLDEPEVAPEITEEVEVPLDESANVTTTTEAPPTTTSTVPPETSTSTVPPEATPAVRPLLFPNGLATAQFGDSFDNTMSLIIEEFGQPTFDQGWTSTCFAVDPAVRSVSWQLGDDPDGPTLNLTFEGARRPGVALLEEYTNDQVEQQEFVSYELRLDFADLDSEEAQLSTPEGVTIDISLEQLRAIFPDVELIEVGIDTQGPNTWVAGGYHGGFGGALASDPAATVKSIRAGGEVGVVC